ncbi:TrbI/VirB10 family protein [Acidithiobacillus caldus]|nr:TrbI/VirB10 family protein [Acidithiobacillus caldus]
MIHFGDSDSPDSQPIDSELGGDLHGPGQTTSSGKPATVNIRGSIKSGKGLSKNGKKVLVAGGVAIPALILTGILLAGHHGVGSSGSSSVELAGASSAPALPTRKPVVAAVVAATASTHSAALSTSTLALTAAQTTGTPEQKPLTPRQKYEKWLVEQHYKDLEGRYLAAQSSLVATGNWTKANDNGSLMNANGQASCNPGAMAAQTGTASPSDIADLARMQRLALAGGSGAQNQAAANQNFMAAQTQKNSGYLNARLHKPRSKSELFAGSVIPAVLITGINSQLPGEITAQVRQTVYNSLNPSEVVIPQGSKLIGVYDSDVQYGQSRVLVAWSRIIYPDGQTVDLQGMSGVNGLGEAGFSQITDNHYFRIFGSAFLISMIGAGAQLAQPQSSSALSTPNAAQTGTAALAQEMDSVSTNMLNKNLDIAPTLKIRPGYLFNVMVSKTMILPPYHN